MNYIKTYLVLILLSVLAITNCKRETGNNQPIQLDIKVDSSKIGPLLEDSILAISFHPPFLWESYNTSLSDRIESTKNMDRSQKRKFMISPKHIFFKYGTNSILSVGEITSLDTSVSKEDRISDYINMITDKSTSEKISKADYLKDGILLRHIQTEVENLVSSKYIFKSRSGKIIQFDYTFRKQNENADKPFIQSSLASIKIN
jgi:hypothetical protein